MKRGLAKMVGKKISAVVFAESPGDRTVQLILAFADGTSFEFRGEGQGSAEVNRTATIMGNLETSGATVRKVFGDVAATMPGQSLESLLERDLVAWRTAKAAIEKAREA